MKWAILGFGLLALLNLPLAFGSHLDLGYDFEVYYEAGKGNYEHGTAPSKLGYIYPKFTALAFKPLTLVDVNTAFVIWYWICVLSWMWVLGKLFKVKYGWIVAILSLYPVWLNLTIGQLNILLVPLCLTFSGSLIAGLFKPYCLVFSLLHLYAFWRSRPKNSRHTIAV